MDPAIWVWTLNLVNLAIWAVEAVTDLLFGITFTRGSRSERASAASAGFSRSAQLVSVVAKANYNPAFPSPLMSAFVFRHSE